MGKQTKKIFILILIIILALGGFFAYRKISQNRADAAAQNNASGGNMDPSQNSVINKMSRKNEVKTDFSKFSRDHSKQAEALSKLKTILDVDSIYLSENNDYDETLKGSIVFSTDNEELYIMPESDNVTIGYLSHQKDEEIIKSRIKEIFGMFYYYPDKVYNQFVNSYDIVTRALNNSQHIYSMDEFRKNNLVKFGYSVSKDASGKLEKVIILSSVSK